MICSECGASYPRGASACSICGAPYREVTPPSNVLAPGNRLLAGAYAVGSPLGQGGFAITYRGSDTRTNRLVAIKEFFPVGCARLGPAVVPAGGWTEVSFREALARFMREGQILSRLHHPSIVHVIPTFKQNNTAYLV